MSTNASGPANEGINFCMRCGEYLPPGTQICPKCGNIIGDPMDRLYAPVPGAKPLSSARRASWLFLFAGLDGLIATIFSITQLDSLVATAQQLTGLPIADVRAALYLMIGLFVLVSLAGIVASYFARKRKHFVIVVIAGGLSLLTVGFYAEASLAALIALVMVFLSKREFQR